MEEGLRWRRVVVPPLLLSFSPMCLWSLVHENPCLWGERLVQFTLCAQFLAQRMSWGCTGTTFVHSSTPQIVCGTPFSARYCSLPSGYTCESKQYKFLPLRSIHVREERQTMNIINKQIVCWKVISTVKNKEAPKEGGRQRLG